MRDDVPRLGLKTPIGGRTIRDVARDCLALARAGLARRGRFGPDGRDETIHLDPLDHIVDDGMTPAEHLLRKFESDWAGSVEPVYDEFAF